MKYFAERKSFTLVELMTVISVLTVLLAITYPAAQAVMNRIHRVKAANNLRTIALAHAQFIADFGRAITFTDIKNISGNDTNTANNFATVLAKYGYINDVSVWAWDFDYKVKAYKRDTSKTFPSEIYDKSTKKIHTHFQGGTFPLSVVCGIVQCPNFDYKTLLKGKYPAAYSRGLKSNGSWMESSTNDNGGVFGTKGGLVAYYDGSVEWYTDTVNKFIKYSNKTKSSTICNAIPNSHQSMGTSGQTDSNFLTWKGYNSCHNI
ncbi:MAG: prepilin-type N-terminal cleavage/methylation domain-containing protein [Puniceicoccales bacterium]|jgi:prepilin-type N-terminal cleavage/methylation domain-containing protein|nr:prepilin-type N-terminal cleavage/methylation domain-containing protein [Puniceicoccales bacterium]